MFAKKSSAQADKQKVSLEKEILFSGSQTSLKNAYVTIFLSKWFTFFSLYRHNIFR